MQFRTNSENVGKPIIRDAPIKKMVLYFTVLCMFLVVTNNYMYNYNAINPKPNPHSNPKPIVITCS